MGMVHLPLALMLALGAPKAPRPVIVELFTSEGCSSCPPADELLRRLEAQPIQGVEVIPLGFHVDYWDGLGWRDRFAAPAFTLRQTAYARAFRQGSLYTPEMVVDGRKGFVGSDGGAAAEAIREAATRPAKPIELALGNGVLRVHLPDPGAFHGSEIWLALTEDGLASEVLRGENGGRRLLHAAVVRRLQKLGPAQDTAVALDLPAGWRREGLRAVVVAQAPGGLEILGAASIPLR